MENLILVQPRASHNLSLANQPPLNPPQEYSGSLGPRFFLQTNNNNHIKMRPRILPLSSSLPRIVRRAYSAPAERLIKVSSQCVYYSPSGFPLSYPTPPSSYILTSRSPPPPTTTPSILTPKPTDPRPPRPPHRPHPHPNALPPIRPKCHLHPTALRTARCRLLHIRRVRSRWLRSTT